MSVQNVCTHRHIWTQRAHLCCWERAKRQKNITCEDVHTEQSSCAAAAPHSDARDSAFPLYWAACIRAPVCSFSCLLALASGFLAVCAHKHICTCPTVTHQYLRGFLLAVVPARAWLFASVCLVLNWLRELHRRRGFTLNGIFGGFYWSNLTSRILSDEARLKKTGRAQTYPWCAWMPTCVCFQSAHLCVCMSAWMVCGYKSFRQVSPDYPRIFGLCECVVLGIISSLCRIPLCESVWQGL